MEKEENNVIEQVSEETLDKMRDFDEEEAYFLLCEIFAYAQATGDYVKFQYDLNEWKKRYDLKYFSEKFRLKIKYMLSEEFIEKVLKDYLAFEELSKKNPADGYAKLKKILEKAEKHKNKSKLDKDLEELFKEFPRSYLKQHYPHRIDLLLSKSNLTKILEKFDQSLALDNLNEIIEHHNDYSSIEEFKGTIDNWQQLYPIADFDNNYKSQVENILKTTLDEQNLNQMFILPDDLDLNGGQVIQFDNINHYAWYDFCKATDGDIHNVDSIFNWLCSYELYINKLDDSIKDRIIEKLNYGFGNKLASKMGKYFIPKMNSDDLLSLKDYNAIDNTKELAILQFIGIISNKDQLTNDDIYNLNIINTNFKKAKMIQDANIDSQVDELIKDVPEKKLTPFTISVPEDLKANISNDKTNIELKNSVEGDKVTVSNEQEKESSFKETLKVTDDIVLERVNSSSNTSSNNSTGATSSGGGGGVSISRDIPEVTKKEEEPVAEEKEKSDSEPENILPININLEKSTPIEAVVIDLKPEVSEVSNKPQLEVDITTPESHETSKIDLSSEENTESTQIDIPLNNHKNTEIDSKESTDTINQELNHEGEAEIEITPSEKQEEITLEVSPGKEAETTNIELAPSETPEAIVLETPHEERTETANIEPASLESQEAIVFENSHEERTEATSIESASSESQEASNNIDVTEENETEISSEIPENKESVEGDEPPIEETTRKSMFKRLFEFLNREDEEDEKEIDRDDE